MKITSVGTYPVWGGERNLLFVIVDTDEGTFCHPRVLGVVFDREAAKGHPFRVVELPHLRRPDGSVTNW